MKLRPYQHTAITDLRKSVARGNKSSLLVLPTGAGKTIAAAEIIRRGVQRKSRALFLAPRRELVYQTSDKLTALGVDHGILMAGERLDRDHAVQIACLPTFHRRIVQGSWRRPLAEIVVIDEAHASMGKMAREVLDLYPEAVRIGMTATPARSDGRGLGEVYSEIVSGPSVAELTADGYLVPVRYFAPTTADLEGVRTQAGDYHQGDLAERMNQPQLIGDVVENWLRIAADRRTVVFAVDRAHAMALHSGFTAAGVASEYLDGNTPNDDRKLILARIRSGESQVLCSVDVLSYGWDEPSVSCGIIARPTKSIARYLQAAGRILRPFEGKQDAILIDHSGVVAKLGFVDDPQPWSLDGKSKLEDRKSEVRAVEERVMTCWECKSEFRPASKCPECGADCTARRQRLIEAHEAELAEVRRRESQPEHRQFGCRTKSELYAMIRGWGKRRGYHPKWAAHQYAYLVGNYPSMDPAPIEPNQAVAGWCKHRVIRYAKSRAAA